MGKYLSKELVEAIRVKSSLKQDVFATVRNVFDMFRHRLANCIEECEGEVCKLDERVRFSFKRKGEYEAEIVFGGEALVFYQHSNVFQFDESNSLWKSSYLKADESRSYVGVIYVYNFLADSLRYGRREDIGYLIARIFVNREGHFLVQGKGDLGTKYSDFVNQTISEDAVLSIIESCIRFALDFDLFVPPYDAVRTMSIRDMQSMSEQVNLATGKRLGFRFSFDDSGGE
jgi:hypothetical protein